MAGGTLDKEKGESRAIACRSCSAWASTTLQLKETHLAYLDDTFARPPYNTMDLQLRELNAGKTRETMVALLETTMAHNLALFAMRLGGLGLRSARRFAPVAHWVSWADAMPELQERVACGNRNYHTRGRDPRGCLGHTAWDFAPWGIVSRCASSAF